MLVPALVLAWLLLRSSGLPADERGADAQPPTTEPAAEPPSVHDRAAAPTPRPAQGAERREAGRDADGRRRDRVRRSLQSRFGRPTPEADRDPTRPGSALEAEPDASAPLPEASWTRLPEDYVKEILQAQLIPAAKSCYEDLAPGSSGMLSFAVVVLGDEDIGGVIDEVELEAEHSSIEGELSECVRQAAYALELDPPASGRGVEEFEFSLEFRDDADTDADEPR